MKAIRGTVTDRSGTTHHGVIVEYEWGTAHEPLCESEITIHSGNNPDAVVDCEKCLERAEDELEAGL